MCKKLNLSFIPQRSAEQEEKDEDDDDDNDDDDSEPEEGTYVHCGSIATLQLC